MSINIIGSCRSRYYQNTDESRVVTTRYGRITVGPTYASLPTDALLELMNYIREPEVVSLLRTCKHFLSISHTKDFWKTLCKLQGPYLQEDPFESLIQNQTENPAERELAYQRLYGLRFKRCEPWREHMLFGYPWSFSKGRCRAVAALPNGNIVMGGAPYHVIATNPSGSIWSPAGKLVLKLNGGAVWLIEQILVLPDGGFVTRTIHTVCIWSLTGERLITLPIGEPIAFLCMALLPNGTFVTGSNDGLVRIWSLTGELLETLAEHTGVVTCIAVRPEGGFVTSSGDGEVIIWSGIGERLATLIGHTKPVNAIAALTNGNIITWSGKMPFSEGDKTGRLWSPDGQCITPLNGLLYVKHIAALPGGGFVTAQLNEAYIHSPNGHILATLEGHTDCITSVAVFPDGRIVTASWDHTVRIWSPKGAPLATLKGHTGWVICVTLLPNGDILTGSNDGTARLWKMHVAPLMQGNRWALPDCARGACAVS